tara:strand:+ start:732 stop:905 length:174 start_codon:yes stop_codon:yes gene_type:complete
MSIIDLLAALILITLPQKASAAILSLPITLNIAFYLGVMMIIKGIYSLVCGILGSDG